MKKKIYSKKRFYSGISSLLLSLSLIIITGIKYSDMNIRMLKSCILGIVLFLFGIISIYRSLDYQYTKKDMQNNDERQKHISLKANNTTLKFTAAFCFFAIIFLKIAFTITKYEGYINILIGVGIVFNFLIISNIISYIYHNKRN